MEYLTIYSLTGVESGTQSREEINGSEGTARVDQSTEIYVKYTGTEGISIKVEFTEDT